MKEIISTDKAPKAIGTYSQAVKVNNLVFVSGQIPLVPETMQLVSTTDFTAQITQVFENLSAIAKEAGGSLQNFIKLNIYLTDLNNFATVNKIMQQYFKAPYPARAAVEISALPKGALVEIEGIISL